MSGFERPDGFESLFSPDWQGFRVSNQKIPLQGLILRLINPFSAEKKKEWKKAP